MTTSEGEVAAVQLEGYLGRQPEKVTHVEGENTCVLAGFGEKRRVTMFVSKTLKGVEEGYCQKWVSAPFGYAPNPDHDDLLAAVDAGAFNEPGLITANVVVHPTDSGNGSYYEIIGMPRYVDGPPQQEAKPPLVQAAEAVGGQIVETIKAPASRPVTEGTAKPSEWTRDILIVDQVLTKIAADIVVAFTHPETEVEFDPEVAADMAVRMWNRIRERHLPPAEEESTDE